MPDDSPRNDEARQAGDARGTAEDAARWSRFLARASRELSASLDYQTTLSRAVRLAVPELADWCSIDVLEEHGSQRLIAAAHADERALRRANAMARRYPYDPDAREGIAKTLRTGVAQRIERITDEMLRGAAQSEEHLACLREAGMRSALIVPLVARGRVLGAITLVWSESARRYSPEDLVRAEELAGRIALAIDNARLYEESCRANQAKSDFLAVMSHELRTPLNAILGYADLLDAGVYEPLRDRQRAQVGRIRLSALHLLEMIEEILSFSRMEAGRETLDLRTTDVCALADGVAELIEPLAEEKGLSFLVRLPDHPLELRTDPTKIRQILLNLLSNAIKFTESGSVELRVWREGDELFLRVRDTGMGIPPDALPYLFEPFWQREQTTTRRAGGTGIGLSVARGYARLLGGDIRVESEPAHGSTFTAVVPVAGLEAA